MSDSASSTPNAPSWRTTASVAAVWLVGCPLAGVLIGLLSGEFGSIGFVVIGTCVGVLGALFHVLLTRNAMFLRRSYPSQVVIAAAAPALPLLLYFVAVVSVRPTMAFLQIGALPICGFAAAAAWVGVEITHRQSV
jgi:hypothetical protein